MVPAALNRRRSGRMRAMAAGSSAGVTVRTSQLASIPAAAKPALKRLTAGPPSPPPPSSSSRALPLLEAVLLEDLGELFVGLGVVVVTLGVGEVEEVPGVRGLERGIDGFDAWVCDGSRWESRM